MWAQYRDIFSRGTRSLRFNRQQPELQLMQHWHDGKDTHLGVPLRGAQCGLDQTRALHRGAVEAAEAGAVHLPPLDLHAGGGGQPLPIPKASWQLEHCTTVAQAGQLAGVRSQTLMGRGGEVHRYRCPTPNLPKVGSILISRWGHTTAMG